MKREGYSYCKACGKDLYSALLEALLCDMPGVKTSLDPAKCPKSDNGHQWEKHTKEIQPSA